MEAFRHNQGVIFLHNKAIKQRITNDTPEKQHTI